jgi:hypothetical protein
MTRDRLLIYLDAETGIPSFPYFIDTCKKDPCPNETRVIEFLIALVKCSFPGIRCIPAGRDRNNNYQTTIQTDLTSAEGRMLWLFILRLQNGLNIPSVKVAFHLLEKAYRLREEPLPPTYKKGGHDA